MIIKLKSLLFLKESKYINDKSMMDDWEDIESFVGEEFHNGAKHQSWTLIPADLLLKTWMVFTKYGRVDEKALLKIWKILKVIIIKIILNSEIKNGYAADNFFYVDSYAEITDEMWERWFNFISDRSGSNSIRNMGECGTGGNGRYSDQAKRLYQLLDQAYNSESSTDLLMHIDKIINFVHGMGEMAHWMVEGGSSTLNKIHDMDTKGIHLTGQLTETPVINELIVNSMSSNNQPSIIAWKDKIFIIDKDTKDLTPVIEFLKQTSYYKRYHGGLESKPSHPTEPDVDDVMDFAKELEDAVVGQWRKDEKELYLYTNNINPSTSLLLRKVIKQLGIHKVTRDTPDDKQLTTHRKNIKGEIPDVLYHGTNSKYIENILQWGILPPGESGSESNWARQKIYHYEVIFLTSTQDNAFAYSYISARQNNAYPFVFQVRIPDKNLFIPDFDADPDRETQQYSNIEPCKNTTFSMRPSTMSLHTGKFGYTGKISPQFIDWIYFKIGEHGEHIKKIRPATLKKAINMMGVGGFIDRMWVYKYNPVNHGRGSPYYGSPYYDSP